MQDAAKDVLAQEIISKEVASFMAKSGSMQEEDLGALEDTIRTALTGRTPPCAPSLSVTLAVLRASSRVCRRATLRRCSVKSSATERGIVRSCLATPSSQQLSGRCLRLTEGAC